MRAFLALPQMVATLSPSLQDSAESYLCLQLLASPQCSGLWLSGGGCGFPATAYFGAVGFRCHLRDLAFDSHSLSLPRGAVPPAVASCVHHPWEKLQRLTGCNAPLPLSLLTSAILNLSLPCLCSQGGFLGAATITVGTVLWLGGELGALLPLLSPLSPL